MAVPVGGRHVHTGYMRMLHIMLSNRAQCWLRLGARATLPNILPPPPWGPQFHFEGFLGLKQTQIHKKNPKNNTLPIFVKPPKNTGKISL